MALSSMGLNFGDSRLNDRGIKVITQMAAEPGLSFPKMADSWGTLKAIYRFLSNNKVNHNKILEPHLKQTALRCKSRTIILAVQDTTFFSYSHHPGVQDLGHIEGYQQGWGMLAHNVLALDGQSMEPLGLLHQEVIVRKEQHSREETYKQRLGRNRESDKWFKGLRSAKTLLADHKRIIHICDREADIYFLIRDILDAGQGFVIRCAKNRRTAEGGLLLEITKKAQPVCNEVIEIARNGNRQKRMAEILISSCRVEISAPKVVGGKGRVIPVNIVVAKEITPPKSQEPLHWILLTSEVLTDESACRQIINYYRQRWIIEDFHKGLKSGCKMEERQLASRHSLQNALSLFSIITAQSLSLRYHASTLDNGQPEDCCLSDKQLAILKNKFPKESQFLDTKTALILIARMGGFIGRKSDGNPGWLTIMRGMYDLLLIEYGVAIAPYLVGKG